MIFNLEDFFGKRTDILEWGIAPVINPPHANNLKTWIDKSWHGNLEFMEVTLNQRMYLKEHYPWASTLGMFSLPTPSPLGAQKGVFKVAAYAQGTDYHIKGWEILNQIHATLLSKFSTTEKSIIDSDTTVTLEKSLLPKKTVSSNSSPASQSSPFQWQGFVDSLPFFERDLANYLGLGWSGKNTCLIHPKHGSGFLLAGFITNLNFSPKNNPIQNFCGTCTACIDSCPTKALEGPGQLNANLCISNWTIEEKGKIPSTVSDNLNGWIFGCDICQEVCPWTKKASKTKQKALLITKQKTEIASSIGHQIEEKSFHNQNSRSNAHFSASISELINFSEISLTQWLSILAVGGGFNRHFRGTPLMRAGRKKVLRNILLNLLNDLNDGLNNGLNEPNTNKNSHESVSKEFLQSVRLKESDPYLISLFDRVLLNWNH